MLLPLQNKYVYIADILRECYIQIYPEGYSWWKIQTIDESIELVTSIFREEEDV